MWLQCVRLPGFAEVPEGKVFLGVAEPWQGEERWENLCGQSGDDSGQTLYLFYLL